MLFEKQLNWLLDKIVQIYSRCHHPRDSLFSWSSKFNNFTGLVNWGFLLLTIGGFRLLLENFIKYGLRIDPWQWFVVLTGRDGGAGYPALILLACKLAQALLGLSSVIFQVFFFSILFLRYFRSGFTLYPGGKRTLS